MNYSGKDCFLIKEQLKTLSKHLDENIYLSASEICSYVLKKYNIQYTIKGMTKLLHRLGFIYKKPKIVPGKADSEKQKAFIEEYEKLKAYASEDDVILFMDGVHPTHNIKASYGWIKKGKKKEILSNTGRKRININTVLDVDNIAIIMETTQTLNSIAVIELFKKTEKNI